MVQGIKGFVDFTSLPVGQGLPVPPPAIPVGFCGIIDWTGLCAGAGGIHPGAPTHGHGFRGAGRRYYELYVIYHLLMKKTTIRKRSETPAPVLSDLIGVASDLRGLDLQVDLFRASCANASTAVLLAEI